MFLLLKSFTIGEKYMHPMFAPIISIIAGVLVLLYPKLLNYVVAIYLILFGVAELLNRY